MYRYLLNNVKFKYIKQKMWNLPNHSLFIINNYYFNVSKLCAFSKYIMYCSDMYILYIIIILFEWRVYDDVDVLFVRLHINFVNN